MTKEHISDEKLVKEFLCGNEGAIDILIKRYYEPLRHYAWKLSWYRDKSFIDDIIQQVILSILKSIKGRRFNPEKGSLKNWVYLICRNITITENHRQRNRPETFSKRFPTELPDHLAVTRPEPKNYTDEEIKLEKALTKLTDEEKQLLLLVSQKYTYPEIQKQKPFDKYTLETLRQKVCRTRQYLVALIKDMTH